GPPRDDRRGPPRDDRRGPPRDDRRGPPRDDRRGPPRDDRRGPPRDDRRSGPYQGRPRPQGTGGRAFDDERQPLTSENPANRSPRGRTGGGGFGGRPRSGAGGRPQRSGGQGGPAKRNTRDEGRSKVYTSDRLVFKENLDEKKPTERKMRSRRTRPSDDSGKKD
ncbi:MAG: hypothetical protein H7X70_01570, partial [Candidatus Kapabacteria bacterium]|nr:hypothetical protein [Candidatus Kapabacteria bacterium]